MAYTQVEKIRASSISIALLLLLTEAIYLPWPVLNRSQTLYGWDYTLLHMRRLHFVRAAWAEGHRLPAWYPRELLGTPFLANLGNFPWIPTHWVLLLLKPENAYAAGIAIAAGLAALFTYLYCRRAGLSQMGAVAAGWTFACAGFFAVRVVTGLLLILEAYASLPLLLWLVDRATDPGRADLARRDIAALAAATAFIVSAGHPQLPAYSVAAALLYVLWRGRGWLRLKLAGAMALGIGASLVVWWPMLLLIGRSTRVLHLDPSANDIVMPYRRLLALIVPGIDGWPPGIRPATEHPFTGYSHPSYFWDTFAYIGILPLAAVALLVFWKTLERRWPASRWVFLGAIGIAGLIGALPLLDPLRQAIPATIFRSPSRLLYLSTFALSAAFGVGVDALYRWNRFGQALAIACLAFHGWDLGHVSRLFIIPTTWHPVEAPEFAQILAREGGDARVAVNRIQSLRLSYDRDDAGAYDSIMLAGPYRELMALAGAPPGLNEEVVDASTWPPRALQAAGVRFVITPANRADLELVKSARGLRMYRVADAAPRTESRDAELPGAEAVYSRTRADRIVVRSSGARAGVVQILEARDPGWAAEVDGVRTPVAAAADGLGMAIPVPAGKHEIVLRYRTPGRTTGAVLSLISVVLLAVLITGS